MALYGAALGLFIDKLLGLTSVTVIPEEFTERSKVVPGIAVNGLVDGVKLEL